MFTFAEKEHSLTTTVKIMFEYMCRCKPRKVAAKLTATAMGIDAELRKQFNLKSDCVYLSMQADTGVVRGHYIINADCAKGWGSKTFNLTMGDSAYSSACMVVADDEVEKHFEELVNSVNDNWEHEGHYASIRADQGAWTYCTIGDDGECVEETCRYIFDKYPAKPIKVLNKVTLWMNTLIVQTEEGYAPLYVDSDTTIGLKSGDLYSHAWEMTQQRGTRGIEIDCNQGTTPYMVDRNGFQRSTKFFRAYCIGGGGEAEWVDTLEVPRKLRPHTFLQQEVIAHPRWAREGTEERCKNAICARVPFLNAGITPAYAPDGCEHYRITAMGYQHDAMPFPRTWPMQGSVMECASERSEALHSMCLLPETDKSFSGRSEANDESMPAEANGNRKQKKQQRKQLKTQSRAADLAAAAEMADRAYAKLLDDFLSETDDAL